MEIIEWRKKKENQNYASYFVTWIWELLKKVTYVFMGKIIHSCGLKNKLAISALNSPLPFGQGQVRMDRVGVCPEQSWLGFGSLFTTSRNTRIRQIRNGPSNLVEVLVAADPESCHVKEFADIFFVQFAKIFAINRLQLVESLVVHAFHPMYEFSVFHKFLVDVLSPSQLQLSRSRIKIIRVIAEMSKDVVQVTKDSFGKCRPNLVTAFQLVLNGRHLNQVGLDFRFEYNLQGFGGLKRSWWLKSSASIP